ncbi:MAG: phosphogluconate dehydratase [Rhodospirillales bacterium RIFCSPLOWO2_12_FULL_58_28]|nr:MAG: phosphogluconate dehydratase [Rhodospirillales bacterium RIFCSPLOWO2_02_FULL_58_16]OHC78716.1 MAG: phosphogluconate dehydratase [Rhodospirillales bacterium RIFCSPLOWO2_12_FULL_58_28]
MALNDRVREVTNKMAERSRYARAAYLDRIRAANKSGVGRKVLSCGNLAHGFAACGVADKAALREDAAPNLAIITAYNDMLSAHQPFERFPRLIKEAAREAGGVAQVAGGVPAMCDGVTQGQAGMELSLFSRDVIAMSAAVALSHNMFDGAIFLGVCDKIAPGMVIAALSFGHLPAVFAPAGPMPSGLPNDEKAKVRQLYAEGKIGRDKLLEAEAKSYHGPGTCTFYGTANSNQMLMEIMGLHLPGASFVNPDTPLRDALTKEAAKRALAISALSDNYTPVGEMIDEKAIVNGVVGLLATGGSTNHTLHLVAMAAAAGIRLDWDDFSALSEVVPLLARVYPNGPADVNHFHAAGGMGFVIGELLDAGLLHQDVRTVWGTGLDGYRTEPKIDGKGVVRWTKAASRSHDKNILRPVSDPFQADGGIKILSGNIGRAVIKTSALAPGCRAVKAPAVVFDSQEDLLAAFKANKLNRDFVGIVRFQGPRANGMPELHKLTPALGIIQDLGYKVALVTDGRMSGASGKVPAAIHVTPEAANGGAIAKVRDGDMICLDSIAGKLDVLVDDKEWAARTPAGHDPAASGFGTGRELFAAFRAAVGSAERGASVFGDVE